KERKEDEERKKRDVAETLEQERTTSILQVAQPAAATRCAPSMSSHTSSLFQTPHDRARFLSDSAPGSRLASVTTTPHTSRPVTPSHAPLRQSSSTTRLYGLLSDNQGSNLSDVAEGNSALSGYAQEQDTNWSTEDIHMREWAPEVASSPYSRNKPIGTGRPRRASMALNQAYNAKKEEQDMQKSRVGKCVLHGEGCDGEYTAYTWRTQHARNTTGFRELVPVVQGEGGRLMVDWEKVLQEEKAKM
ncbi:hypothetical protein DE146DRAFT_781331, partial [Phaeosphaeria sp. MPI-PUGE-AT-0046c]